jgi:hypothetical protein
VNSRLLSLDQPAQFTQPLAVKGFHHNLKMFVPSCQKQMQKRLSALRVAILLCVGWGEGYL